MKMDAYRDVLMTSCDGCDHSGRNGGSSFVKSFNTSHTSPSSLVLSSDGEESSLESAQPSMEMDCVPTQSFTDKKRVKWDRIETRQFALVVGDHPLCQDGLPVSLDWQYSDAAPSHPIETIDVSERKQSYAFPRRLSYQERKERLCSVSGLTLDQVRNEEIDLVVKTLRESWDDIVTDDCGMQLEQQLQQEPLFPQEVPEQEQIQTVDPLQDLMVWDEVQGIDYDVSDVTDFEWDSVAL